jgi:hypothetical protein
MGLLSKPGRTIAVAVALLVTFCAVFAVLWPRPSHIRLGYLALEEGDFFEAEHHYRDALKLATSNPEYKSTTSYALEGIARAKLGQGRPVEALVMAGLFLQEVERDANGLAGVADPFLTKMRLSQAWFLITEIHVARKDFGAAEFTLRAGARAHPLYREEAEEQ